jgi:hypothetical protein
MMNKLKHSEADAFLKRFYYCDDGVIRSVEVMYPYGWFTLPAPLEQETKRVNIILSVPDSQLMGNWCNLIITMLDVKEVKVDEPHEGCHSILSDGLKFGWFDNLVFIDFSHEENDLVSANGFRKVNRCVAGRELIWRVEPYDR